MDCPIHREQGREAGGLTEKAMPGSAIDESPKAAGSPGLQTDRGKERYQEGETGGETREEKPALGRSAPKVSIAEKLCGKCDHSFNSKLSGVNKEYVAARQRRQDY